MTDSNREIKSILADVRISGSEAEENEEFTRNKLEEGAYRLVESLGYNEENLFLNVQLKSTKLTRSRFGLSTIQFDILAAKKITAPPYLTIKTALGSEESLNPSQGGKLAGYAEEFLRSCHSTARPKHSVLLTNVYLAILSEVGVLRVYRLSELNPDNLEEISNKLSPPNVFPEGLSNRFPPGHHPNQTKLTRWLFPDSEIIPEYRSEISSEYFELDIDEYADKLYSAYSASSSNEKGELFEDVIEFLLQGIKPVCIKDRNLRTRTGEIDFVLEQAPFELPNLFDYQSRYVLVEAKNVAESVSTSEIASFEKKLNKSNSSLGILFAWNGVSGEESGDYGQRYIDSDSPDGMKIIVMDSRDLYRILDGDSLYKILDEKIYSLRFDL